MGGPQGPSQGGGRYHTIDERDPKAQGAGGEFSGLSGPGKIDQSVLAQRLEHLQVIAKNVALDAALEVKLGDAGGGSYCAYGRGGSPVALSLKNRSITIDPHHLLDPRGEFIVGHEGMHAHVTFSPFNPEITPALKRIGCSPEDLHKEIGLGALLNYLEDCGGNSWLMNAYPGLKESAKSLYDEMLRQENPTMSTPEVNAIAAQLGSFPKFAQFGSEVMKKWWTGEYSRNVDPDVAAALKKHEKDVTRYLQDFSAGQTTDLQQRQIDWVGRYLTAVKDIYPTIKQLVDKDIDKAAQQQLANQMQKAEEYPWQPQQEQQQQQDQGQQNQQGQGQQNQQGQGQQNQQGQGQQGNASQPGGSRSSSGDQSSDDARSTSSGGAAGGQFNKQLQDEINNRAAHHQDKLRRDLGKELDKMDREINQRGDEKGREGDNASSGRPPTEQELSQKIEQLKDAIKKNLDGDDAGEQRAQRERQLETLEKLNEEIKKQSAPLDTLSQQAQEAIKEAFKDLTAQEREALRKKAKELLEDFEDKVRDSQESTLEDPQAPKHADQRKALEIEQRKAQLDKKLDDDIKEMEKARLDSLGEWDRARESIAKQVSTLYTRLERILRPTVPEWDEGHPSGSRVNPFAVMQAEADRKLITKIWERKTLPVEKSFRFSLLVDISGSMDVGEKYVHSQACAVLMSEVLTRLNVPFEISVFNNDTQVVKPYDVKKPKKEEKNRIAEALVATGGNTVDYDAVDERATALATHSEENRFLVVITDGGSSNPEALKSALKRALADNIRVIGIGIGAETTDVDKYYPIGRGGLTIDPKDKENGLTPYFGKLLEKILINPEGFLREALRKKEDHG